MNTYLKSFSLPTDNDETEKICDDPEFSRTCYNNIYPFKTIPKYMRRLEFAPITILYGANGSGKSTILNLIAMRLGIKRSTKINKSSFMDTYVDMCHYKTQEEIPISKIITSDDVFSKLFLTREKNDIIDNNRKDMIRFSNRCNTPGVYIRDIMREEIGDGNWIENIDVLQSVVKARGKSASMYAKGAGKNIIGKSNGETALEYFYQNVSEPGLYLLDEPENSLSAVFQNQLAEFLFQSARFFGAQLIISTHSPFMLSMPEAVIYNLDEEDNPQTFDWTKLNNMIEYYKLFAKYRDEFEKNED